MGNLKKKLKLGLHLGEFPIEQNRIYGLGSLRTLKSKTPLKAWAVFLYLSEEFFFLYHVKAYLYSFILSRGYPFLGAVEQVGIWVGVWVVGGWVSG